MMATKTDGKGGLFFQYQNEVSGRKEKVIPKEFLDVLAEISAVTDWTLSDGMASCGRYTAQAHHDSVVGGLAIVLEHDRRGGVRVRITNHDGSSAQMKCGSENDFRALLAMKMAEVVVP